MDVDNVLFQIDLDNDGGWIAPTLSYGIGEQYLAGTEMIISSVFDPNGALGTATSLEILYQWDLSGVAGSIGNYRIEFGTGAHVPIPEISLASSSLFTAVTVPEPSSSALFAIGALGLALRRKH